MTDRAKLVLAGFVKLSSDDQAEVIDELNRYIQARGTIKKSIQEGFEREAGRVCLGPVTQGCPCCGR